MNSRRRLWTILALIVIAVGACAVALTVVSRRLPDLLRNRVTKTLETRYRSKVMIGSLRVRLVPWPSVSGENVKVWLHGRTDLPPTMELDRFSASAGVVSLLGGPLHVRSLRLEGLRLRLPHPGSQGDELNQGTPNLGASAPSKADDLVIDSLIADGAHLELLPKVAGKDPLVFDIAHLRLRSAGRDARIEFRADLTNPKPPGLIAAQGHLGPWSVDEPSDTPVDGKYSFAHADLGVFKGISGILASTGEFHGRLNSIEVNGKTDVPNFMVTTGGHPVELTTEFHAIVNGSDGDTYLEPVNAHFLNTWLLCRGKVEHQPGIPGKQIHLHVTMTKGRVEDLLYLAVKGSPLMTGITMMKTDFLLPPGPGDVMDRLRLAGSFTIARGRFTKDALQEKMTDLSLRAQGRPNEAQERNTGPNAVSPEDVASNLHSDFTLKDAQAAFSNLDFDVPGAAIQLNGTYGLNGEKLDFQGVFRMEARVSQAFTGWKALVLKAADPFLSKKGVGTRIPIRIQGTREKPEFGLAFLHR